MDESCAKNEQNQICRSKVFLQLLFFSFFYRTRFNDSKPFWKKRSKFPWGPKLEALTVAIVTWLTPHIISNKWRQFLIWLSAPARKALISLSCLADPKWWLILNLWPFWASNWCVAHHSCTVYTFGSHKTLSFHSRYYTPRSDRWVSWINYGCWSDEDEALRTRACHHSLQGRAWRADRVMSRFLCAGGNSVGVQGNAGYAFDLDVSAEIVLTFFPRTWRVFRRFLNPSVARFFRRGAFWVRDRLVNTW